jgi:Flp pilus assembly protein TadD
VEQAESVFVALLSDSPGDARALTNLGNLRVLEGDLDVALVFYNQAVRADASDAGIKLNRATSLMLMGDLERAEAEAAEAVRQAGSEEAAAKLIGLSTEAEAGETRASDKPFVSKQEIRALLSAAKSRVPGDSLGTGAPADSTKANSKSGKKTTTWRSAGPRAGDAGDIAAVLYWKR